MKTILFISMSVNGYIARQNGEEDFISNEDWDTFSQLVKECGCFVVGRKTYEQVKNWDEDFGFDDFVGIKKVVISKNPNYKVDEGYVLATSPEDALGKLKNFETVLIAGGSKINSSFAKANLIDEIILNIEPVIVGNGIPLFSNDDFDLKLELQSQQKTENGIVTLKYHVKK